MKVRFLLVLSCMIVGFCSCDKDDNDGWVPEKSRTYIVISDIHLGDQRAAMGGYGWNRHEKDTLIAFMDYIKSAELCDEIVVAGDFIDEWVSPPDSLTFADKNGNMITEREFFRGVVDFNYKVFDKFRELKNAGIDLTYVPGNHDMQVTEADFEDVLPGVFQQSRTKGVEGMGDYRPEDDLFIEHGHRYDIMNAPYIGKNGVDNISGSILPPGFFVSKLNCGHKVGNNQMASTIEGSGLDAISYNIGWAAIGMLFGQEDVVTMTDGMTKTYSFDEYAYNTSKLYYGIDDLNEENDGWRARCKRLGAVFEPSVAESLIASVIYDFCDGMALKILEETDFEPRILVWGHSHAPKFYTTEKNGEKRVYVNTGCWIDSEECGEGNNSTFCKVTVTEGGKYEVSLCRFMIDNDGQGKVEVINEDSIEN